MTKPLGFRQIRLFGRDLGGGVLSVASNQQNDQQNGEQNAAGHGRGREHEMPDGILVDPCAKLRKLGVVRLRQGVDLAVQRLPVRAVGVVVAPLTRSGLTDLFPSRTSSVRKRMNSCARVPVVLPITTGGGFARTAGFAVSLMGAGLQTTGVVRCDQPRALDLKARSAKKLETVPDAIIDEVLSKVGPLFEYSKKLRLNPCGSRKFDPGRI